MNAMTEITADTGAKAPARLEPSHNEGIALHEATMANWFFRKPITVKLAVVYFFQVALIVITSVVGWVLLGSIEDGYRELGASSDAIALLETGRWVLAATAAISLFCGITATVLVSRDITGLIVSITRSMRRLADGDNIDDTPGQDRHDELGEMARALEVFRRASFRLQSLQRKAAETAKAELEYEAEKQIERERMQETHKAEMVHLANQFEQTIADVVGGVATASSQLQATASSMAASAEQSASQSSDVAKAMSDASSGVTAAASASDEFAMSIGEISRQAASSAELARKANTAAGEADRTIAGLSDSAQQIGQVVELIQSIAQRTNLLALNASIEAARGGEAGRGFAVVAAEVKELASQTSKATQDVAGQIRAMQDATGASVSALHSITDQIEQLEATAISIASAVDQQSVAGQDLARSIDIAARGTDEVSANVGQLREAALATGAAASQMLSSSTDLEGQAATLKRQVEDFLAHVRKG